METVLGIIESYGVLSYFLFFAYCALKSGALLVVFLSVLFFGWRKLLRMAMRDEAIGQ